MAELKTQRSAGSVADFIAEIDAKRKPDAERIHAILQEEIGDIAMYGDSIVGAGCYKYVYKSGQRGEWFIAGFSPRKANITIYLSGGYEEQADLLGKLGKFKHSVSCLYVNKLADIDEGVLREMIRRNTEVMRRIHPQD